MFLARPSKIPLANTLYPVPPHYLSGSLLPLQIHSSASDQFRANDSNGIVASRSPELDASSNDRREQASMSLDYLGRVNGRLSYQQDTFARLVSTHASDTHPVSVKPKRKPVNSTQLRALNEVYAKTAYPSAQQRAELAERLSLPAKRVHTWRVAYPILRRVHAHSQLPWP